MNTKNKEIPKSVYLVANSQIFPVRNLITKIGRKLENDLVLREPMVSRFHAEICFEEDKYFITDKDSTSGTFLNNKKIEKAQLYSGDTILLANIPLLFLVESSELESKTTGATESLKPETNDDLMETEEKTKPHEDLP